MLRTRSNVTKEIDKREDLRLDENKVDVDLVIFVTAPRSPSLVPRSPGPRGLRLELFKAKICLVTSFREQSYIEILPHNKNPLREAWLSFWSEVHYNSLYSSGGKDSVSSFNPAF
ncbi:hypothetical protein F2Q68_00016872 [Brassica cretica]|uniref:OTU domain-containing protein n=1 Tax=Brassica cretica TaxID=69181 RepID=A0A8S9HG52_BRACR|nr:hypothetical protein F2Q68_00016872 [Brassica cretica]